MKTEKEIRKEVLKEVLKVIYEWDTPEGEKDFKDLLIKIGSIEK